MASVTTSQSEEQSFCSICLDVFIELVSTPCWHNCCKKCIKDYWALSDISWCPLCKETFHRARSFSREWVLRGEDSCPPARPGDVLCHGMKHKAQKSCLVALPLTATLTWSHITQFRLHVANADQCCGAWGHGVQQSQQGHWVFLLQRAELCMLFAPGKTMRCMKPSLQRTSLRRGKPS